MRCGPGKAQVLRPHFWTVCRLAKRSPRMFPGSDICRRQLLRCASKHDLGVRGKTCVGQLRGDQGVIRSGWRIFVGAFKALATPIRMPACREQSLPGRKTERRQGRKNSYPEKEHRAGCDYSNAQSRRVNHTADAKKIPIGASSTTSHRHGNCRNRSFGNVFQTGRESGN